MNVYLMRFKEWYSYRNFREQILVLSLSFACIYAFFHFFFFSLIDAKKNSLQQAILDLETQVSNWKKQVSDLKKIANMPLYQQWLTEHASMKKMSGQYQYLFQKPYAKQYQEIIQIVLQSKKNITLSQIKNLPETLYEFPKNGDIKNKIYQQGLSVVIFASYLDTFEYVDYLEKTLPNIRWNKFDYQVVQYPLAKIEMELSFFYEKAL